MKVTKQDLQDKTDVINNFFGFEKYKLEPRNSFIYFEEVATHKTLFDYALTKSELLCALKGFFEGLTFKI